MGPQLYRCGNAAVYTHLPLSLSASMGPQLYRCGNYLVLGICEAVGGELQWGRNFIVAEMKATVTTDNHDSIRFNGAATLSLRKYGLKRSPLYDIGLGFNGAATLSLRKYAPPQHHTIHNHASMGPQLYRCGNVPLNKLVLANSGMLQWGRNFIVAEMDLL